MKVKELQFGDFFQCELTTETIVARIVGKNVVYLNTAVGCHYCHPTTFWEKLDVIPIDYKTAVALIIKDCMEHNQNVPENTQETVIASTLKPGTYFVNKNNIVGMIFDENSSIYFIRGKSGFWDHTPAVGEVKPLTIHQAALILAQQQIEDEKKYLYVRPIGKPIPNKNHDVFDVFGQDNDYLKEIENMMKIPPLYYQQEYNQEFKFKIPQQ